MTEIKEKKARKPRAKKTAPTETLQVENKEAHNVENLPQHLVDDILNVKPNVAPLEVQTAITLPVKQVFKTQEEIVLQAISAEIQKEKDNRYK